MINIIREEKSDKFELRFNEMFNDGQFKSSAHIQTFYENFRPENSKFTEHEHGGLAKESWLTIKNLTLDQVKKGVRNFIEIIKANPRIRE